MKKLRKGSILTVLKIIPFAVCIACIIWYLTQRDNISVQSIINYTPDNRFTAALILIGMYAVKSLSIVFPVMVIEAAGGYLFGVSAIFINIIGMALCLTLPYWIGRFSGMDLVDKLMKKYPRLEGFVCRQKENDFFIIFFLRVINCLPLDIVGMYFGAVRMPFWKYLAASLLGMMPGLIMVTLIGTSITEPKSAMFVVSVAVTVGFSLLSALIYYIYKRRKSI